MRIKMPILYRLARRLLRVALGFYFTRIERFHCERVPISDPLLFASNHPNSAVDAFVISTSVPRKVNFVATVQLFRLPLVRWLLSQVGVIPINRLKDDPRAMRTVMDTFEACFRVLERGEAIGIFPEGITHDEPQLKNIKTGAARMALELEYRHRGKLGLQIVPVGLTFSAKERYRSEVLVHFGEPIQVTAFLQHYPEQKHECIHTLTTEIEHRIQILILHLPKLERARIVAAVKRLYLDRLRIAHRVVHEPVPPSVDELLLTQAIAQAVDEFVEQHPQRAAAFVQKLDRYEHWLTRLRLREDALVHFPPERSFLWLSFVWAMLALAAAPVAAYGWIHRFLPLKVIGWAINRYAETSMNKTHVATTVILAGLISFTTFYAALTALVYYLVGWPWALWYALSLPVAGLVAHYYALGLSQFTTGLRVMLVFTRAPFAAKRLLALRSEMIAEIEAGRKEFVRSLSAAKGN